MDWRTTIPYDANSLSPPATQQDVERCYRDYLGREPDPEGFAYWMGVIHEGMSVDRLQGHMIASQEFHGRSTEDKVAALAGLGVGEPRVFPLAEIETVAAALNVEGFRGQVLIGTFGLPDGFDPGIDPDTPEYRHQQLALWSAITQRPSYDPAMDEDTPEIGDLDAIRRPAFYSTGDADVAGEHIVALGHILKLSGLKAGARALEYGAGFGQIALAFARLGLKVDTVDINPAFSAAVSKLAAHYGVDLTSHVESFGFNPAGEPGAYDLIYFYESFHHCLDFKAVIPRLAEMLRPGGKIIMAGEPILDYDHPLMPYPWGLRLDGECVTIMRRRGWMELGFREPFLLSTFRSFGFEGTKHVIPGFHYPTAYVFQKAAG